MKARKSRNRKVLVAGIERWRETRNRGKYLKYYIKPAGNGRNILAKNIDFYGLLAAAFIVISGLTAGYTGDLSRAALISFSAMAVITYAAFRIRRSLEMEARAHMSMWKAGRLCQDRIKNIGGGDLEKLISELLEKLPGFSDVHLVKKTEEDAPENYCDVPVRAIYRGETVGIGCLLPGESGQSIPVERVTQFIDRIKELGIKKGILVAAGVFSGEAKRVAVEEKRTVKLLDIYRLVDLCRVTGHRMFPTLSNENKEAEIKTGTYRRLFRNALRREKAKSYLLTSILMFLMFFTAPEGLLRAVYAAFSLINLFLSVYCVISNRETEIIGQT
ncbi:MAG: restriction endonuclease [Bacillota bacterium]